MILDVHFRETHAEQSCRDHGADEGRAVAADDHRDSDRKCRDAEALADRHHDREHTVEVAVRIEGKCERHREETDDQRQVGAEGCRKNHRNEIRHAVHDARDFRAVDLDILDQDTHENGSAHQGGAHQECRDSVCVQHLLLELNVRVVHENRDTDTKTATVRRMLKTKSFGRASSRTFSSCVAVISTLPSVCASLPFRPAPRAFS